MPPKHRLPVDGRQTNGRGTLPEQPGGTGIGPNLSGETQDVR
jgi:hypothetical protein